MKNLLIGTIAFLGLIVLTNSVVVYKVHKDTKVLNNTLDFASSIIQSIPSEIENLQSEIEKLQSVPMALKETFNGVRFTGAEHGLTRFELDFLIKFRSPLLKKEHLSDHSKLAEQLKKEIETSYVKNKYLLSPYSLNNSSEQVAHAMLRVNGSMPVYQVRRRSASNIEDALLWTNGSCSDFSLRLMLALEAMGLKAAMISNITESFPGHVFVDAYDPKSDTAYLLDANYNVMIEMPQSGNKSFVEKLFLLDPKSRSNLAESIKILTFPVYFKFVNPGLQAYSSTAITTDILNEHRANREVTWRRWLSNDTDELKKWWRKAPDHKPRTLAEINKAGVLKIPDTFDKSGNYATKILTAADLTNEIVSN